MTARLDAVEIKITIGHAAMARALQTFEREPSQGEPRSIYFCEKNARLPLLESHLILRLRENHGGGGDSTVKFRPLEPIVLGREWDRQHIDGTDIKVEADWVGERKVVSASTGADQDEGEVHAAAHGLRPLSKLFSEVQERFLTEHRAEPVDLNTLQILGPIDATKWDPTDLGFGFPVAAERWIVGELSFLELSIRVEDPALATAAQKRFQDFVTESGFSEADLEQETKTRRVLEHLTRQ